MISPVLAVSTRRHLRSAGQGDLAVLQTRTTGFGPRSFSVAGPLAWNSLPPEIKMTSLTFVQFEMFLHKNDQRWIRKKKNGELQKIAQDWEQGDAE